MKKLLIPFLVVFVTLAVCGCEDERVSTAKPRVDLFHIGDSDVPVPLSQFGETPGSGELAIDFGQVDVETISRRYLFMRNSGTSALNVSAVEFSDASSDDFYVSCLNDANFEVDCPYSPQNLLWGFGFSS